jgi:hypothetical protein
MRQSYVRLYQHSFRGLHPLHLEIDLPRNLNDKQEKAIAELATAIAQAFSWIMDDDHGLLS